MVDHDPRLLRLIEVGRSLSNELDQEVMLQRVLIEARALTGARHAVLEIHSGQQDGLTRLIDSQAGAPPCEQIGGHASGRDVLEVPIMIDGGFWGNLHVCEKLGAGEFAPADRDAATMLAQLTAAAVARTRLHAQGEQHQQRAQRLQRALEAAQEIASAIGSVNELSDVLGVIVRRGQSLVDAQTVLIMLREGEDLVVVAAAGQIDEPLGRRIPIRGSSSGGVLLSGRPQRAADAGTDLVRPPTELGVSSAHAALLVPMLHRGVAIGVLAAFDRGADGDSFRADDERLLRTYAASAANAVTIKRSVQSDRLRAAIAAAEAERRRWARELHDQTLQTLGALRVLLASALRRGDPALHEQSIRQAVADIELETANLRGIITDLRPPMLDDLGLAPALESLIERRRETGLTIESEIMLDADGYAGTLGSALETTIYRLVQEALTNVIKHSDADRCAVALRSESGQVEVEVTDNGHGYDPHQHNTGFGIPGMRERVYLVGGELQINSSERGTVVLARFPTEH